MSRQGLRSARTEDTMDSDTDREELNLTMVETQSDNNPTNNPDSGGARDKQKAGHRRTTNINSQEAGRARKTSEKDDRRGKEKKRKDGNREG